MIFLHCHIIHVVVLTLTDGKSARIHSTSTLLYSRLAATPSNLRAIRTVRREQRLTINGEFG